VSDGIPDEALDGLADDLAAAIERCLAVDFAAAIEKRFPLGVTPEQARPHVAGFLAAVLNQADEDERSPL